MHFREFSFEERGPLVLFLIELFCTETCMRVLGNGVLDGHTLAGICRMVQRLDIAFTHVLMDVSVTPSCREVLCKKGVEWGHWLWEHKWQVGAIVGISSAITAASFAIWPILPLVITTDVAIASATTLTTIRFGVPLAIGVASGAAGFLSFLANSSCWKKESSEKTGQHIIDTRECANTSNNCQPEEREECLQTYYKAQLVLQSIEFNR